MRCIFACAILLTANCFLISARAVEPAGQSDFLHGLDALQHQQWKDAAKAFAAAADADDENAQYHTAFAIASMMTNDLRTAKSEFDRSLKLNPKDVTTHRWAAGYYRFTGDALTASRIQSPADYSGTVQEAAEKVYQMRFDHVSPQEAQHRWDTLHGFAVAYANERKGSSPQLTAASFDRAQQLFQQGKIDEALADLQTVLTANPYDNNALFLQARCVLAKGYFFGAREQLTRVLTMDTRLGTAYAARAIVEAKLGRLDRAAADESLARKLDPQSAEQMRADYEHARSSSDQDASSDPLLRDRQLVEASQSVDNADTLVDAGISVHRAENNRRKHWDEIYQDRLRGLEDDLRADPNNIAHLMALGKFLYLECQTPGEQLSPGGKYRPFRFSNEHTRSAEITRADKIFDQIFVLDPRNAEALTWKAAIRLDNGNFDDGEALVNQAIQINPDLPQLLELLSRVLDNTATLQSYQASDLRTPKSWTQFGISYDIIWTHYPSQDELDRAQALQDRANQLWANAEQSLSAAVAKMNRTADGFYYAGLLKSHQGDENAALADYQQAAKLDPNSNRNRQALIGALFKLGQEDQAADEKERWALEHQTTATMRLAKVWGQMDRTAWKSAQTTLDSAMKIDPADARIPAYRAAIEAARSKPQDAARWLIVALALEQSRIKLGGIDLSPNAQGLVYPEAAGLTLLLNLHLAWRFHDLGQTDKELATLQRNLSLEARIPQASREISPPGAVLPTPSDPRSTKARTISNLLTWSHVMAGYALVNLNKPADALQQFQQVAALYKRESYADAQGLAVNESTRLYWAAHDPDRSQRPQWLANAKIMNRMDDDERNRAFQLIDQAGRAAGLRIDQIQQQQMDLNYWYGATPAQPGGYDPRANPNYHGNDDAPPGMVPQ
ncbi:MAG TPA: tetratricopeptide repeat protein [Tepidisphaeraceae bacterium]|jgi:tetratricopeptide (TPR) repeat protein|nr:tetratricopeptide repeat protein [Tepidisphaeraceae bacterium]